MNTQDKKPVQSAGGAQNGSQMRITLEEQQLIQSTFKNNERLLKLMRKMFLPEIDPNAPIGQLVDLWLSLSIKDMSPEQAYQHIMARNQVISHVDQVLMQLFLISNMEQVSPEEAKAKMVADGSK